ncbi:MAG TPA: alginate export family protein, partial [Novosphingobium sp.]|nr:alginate export family protein [Novosphingobium sp.]
ERDNWGVRFWRRKKGIDFDLELNKQTGTFAGKTIDAWAVLFEGGYTFDNMPLKPRLGARFNAFSGDGNISDNKAGTFVPASARLPLISEAAFFNLSNLVDFYPSVTVRPAKNVSVMVGPDFLWRESRADGVYIGSTGASFAPYGSTHRIGTDLNLEASYQMTKRLSFRLFETYFDPGQAFKAAGGSHGNYFGFLTDLRF